MRSRSRAAAAELREWFICTWLAIFYAVIVLLCLGVPVAIVAGIVLWIRSLI